MLTKNHIPESGGCLGKQHCMLLFTVKTLPQFYHWPCNICCTKDVLDATRGAYVQFYEIKKTCFPTFVKNSETIPKKKAKTLLKSLV